MKSQEKSLFTSTLSTLGIFSVIQFGFFALTSKIYAFRAPLIYAFFVTQLVFHTALVVFLWGMRRFFYNVETKERLTHLNLANKITLFRLSMLPTVLFLILAAKHVNLGAILIPSLAITFFTDMIDGTISRKGHQITQIGKIIDSVSDYSLLIVVAIAYYAFNLLPGWLFGLILFRLFFQALGMLSILAVRKNVEPKPTIFGKIAIATTMTLFATEALKLIVPVNVLHWFRYIEYISAVIIGSSVIDKGIFFHREITRGNIEGASLPGDQEASASETDKDEGRQ